MPAICDTLTVLRRWYMECQSTSIHDGRYVMTAGAASLLDLDFRDILARYNNESYESSLQPNFERSRLA